MRPSITGVDVASAAKDVVRRLAQAIPIDRRMRFRDVHLMDPAERIASSPVLQFYSSVDNIGNYLPVAAIRDYLNCTTDTWCTHRPVDFDYVNANYRAVIIGGAGLVFRPFEGFWHEFAARCRLPFIIWGVGVCVPDTMATREAVPFADVFKEVCSRADLINVRDDITAELTARNDVSLTACPSLSYIDNFRNDSLRGPITLAMHDRLVGDDEHRQLRKRLTRIRRVVTTTNLQNQFRGVDDVIQRRYLGSSLVVSTRLHGAIVAYGLGIPYVALARDEKLRAFARIYGGGVETSEIDEVVSAMKSATPAEDRQRTLGHINAFAGRANGWLTALTR